MVKRSLLIKMLLCKKLKRKRTVERRERPHQFNSPDDDITSENPEISIKIEPVESGNNVLDSCRVCLKTGYIPIFGDDTNEDLSDALVVYANITICNEDQYPKNLCNECHALLRGAMLLRKTAEQTDKVLRFPKQESEDEQIFDNDINFDFSDEIQKRKVEIHPCTLCNVQFDTLSELIAHRRTQEHIEQKDAKQTCTICNKEYGAIYYKRHMAIHEGQAPYICDICGKTFIMQGHFTRHRQTHGFELKYHCHLCPYRGRYSTSLKLHLRTHTGDKPYHCPECPMQCISKSNLNKHMSTHKKEHNFSCDSCGKGFYGKRDLELHFKVDHGGLKEHVCNICGKEFGYRKQMMKHQLKVHKREKMRGGRMPTYLLVDRKKELGEIMD